MSFLLLVGINIHSFSQDVFNQWPKLNAFHEIMSETFHASETGNLKPLKQKSGALVKTANELKKSKIPLAYDSPQIRNSINKLNMESAELNQLVKNKAADEKLIKKISELHNVFHEVVGLCKSKSQK